MAHMTLQEKAAQLGCACHHRCAGPRIQSAEHTLNTIVLQLIGTYMPSLSHTSSSSTCRYALFGCSPSAGGYIGGCNAWAGSVGNSGCAKRHTASACEAIHECYWVTRGGRAQCLSTGGLEANAQDGPAVRNEIQRRVMNNTRLKIPASFYGETTHCGGARGTTVFPMPCLRGSSWNTTLVGAIAAANALELRSAGGDQALSPILQVATDPRFGRLEGVLLQQF